MNLPAEHPPERTITHDWYSPHRKHRIDEVLTARADFTVTDLVALQTDTVSKPARRIVDRLRATHTGPEAQRARTLLTEWDGDLRADSPAAALFEVWYRRHLRPALLGAAVDRIVGPERRQQAVRAILPAEELLADARVDLDLLEQPGDRLGDHPDDVINHICDTTLAAADADCVALLGNDPQHWQWGQLHTAAPAHPLAHHLPSVAENKRRIPPLPRGGSGETVGNTAYRPSFIQSSGTTFRIAVDVGNWDQSRAMNTPGQSGDPRSKHYDDLFTAWAADESFPLLYNRSAILNATEEQILLLPTHD